FSLVAAVARDPFQGRLCLALYFLSLQQPLSRIRCAHIIVPPMDWDDLRLFLAVARSGQILAAARRLDLNHATVARRLSGLEQALKVKLVDRRTTGCLLTEAGERLLARAERIEAELIA